VLIVGMCLIMATLLAVLRMFMISGLSSVTASVMKLAGLVAFAGTKENQREPR